MAKHHLGFVGIGRMPMIVGSAVRQILAITSARHGPDSDFTSMVKTIEEWAGVEVGG